MAGLERHSNEIVVEQVFTDALSWLNIVGEYDCNLPKVDSPYNHSIDRALGFVVDRISAGDLETATLLATFERQARVRELELPVEDAARVVRTNQMYTLAHLMNGYAEATGLIQIQAQ